MKRLRLNASRAVAALALAASAPLFAQTTPPADAWTWRATLYLWGPSINGTTNFKDLNGGGEIDTDVNPGGYLSRLEFAFMGTIDARRGPWSVNFDGIYLNFGNHSSRIDSISGPGGGVAIPVDSGATTNLEGFVGTLSAGYAVLQQTTARADVLAGIRYARLKSSLSYELATPVAIVPQSSSAEATTSLTDGIVGARGSVDLSSQWFVPWYVDAGAGSSRFTWQAMGGVGYRFSWGDAILAYRHLSYDFHSNRVASDVQFSGPAVALSFRF